ncbi:MAG: fructose-6-phosphate aldolase [Acidobacteria bacterium]|nr:fructose-6-phosphate aldolase [Acidobacteriota bacterium]
MKFFLDTANLEEIRQAASLGVLDGVTTNPSLVAKEGAEFEKRIYDICEIVQGPVSAEVVSTDTEGMIAEAHKLKNIHRWVVVKLPTIPDGLKAAKRLLAEGTKVNMTLCFSASQALLVGKLGATYVSPFVGRLDDISHVGMDLIRDIVTIYRNYSFTTQVLAASLRHPLHVVDAAKAGAHVATMPYKVIEQLIKHPLTDKGLAQFLKDWEKAQQSLVRA